MEQPPQDVSVGGWVRFLRTHLQMSQEQLAARCGLPQSYLSRLEGDIVSPQINTVQKIFGALGCSLQLAAHQPANWLCEKEARLRRLVHNRIGYVQATLRLEGYRLPPSSWERLIEQEMEREGEGGASELWDSCWSLDVPLPSLSVDEVREERSVVVLARNLLSLLRTKGGSGIRRRMCSEGWWQEVARLLTKGSPLSLLPRREERPGRLPAAQVPTALSSLCDDLTVWQRRREAMPYDLALRLHAGLWKMAPYSRGNDLWARTLADLFLRALGARLPLWHCSPEQYDDLLRLAASGDLAPLRSLTTPP